MRRLSCPTLVGRCEELTSLCDAFTAAGDGSGGFVVLEGEAGIGKTRLVEAFTAIVVGPGGPAPFLPACGRRADGPGRPGAGRRGAGGPALGRHLDVRSPRVPGPGAPRDRRAHPHHVPQRRTRARRGAHGDAHRAHPLLAAVCGLPVARLESGLHDAVVRPSARCRFHG
ncbi:ATP-binding protein [Actinomadura rudentiformis]|uniref:ATP-binding protein n=1 Tax=Actinomadura rudentiformis TaxID=359158 RepID=A0A6H9YRQ4_9ACTN|nr:ATP-binding protein [Actinomadura rudentiformis]